MPFDDHTGLYQSPYERDIQIIAKARTIIELRGLMHGSLGQHGFTRCLAGAILEASGVDTSIELHRLDLPRLIAAAAVPSLRKRHCTSIPHFNDNYNDGGYAGGGATKRDALAFLDEVRNELQLRGAHERATAVFA